MARQYKQKPGLGAGLNLLDLFGLDSATARVWGASIVVLTIACFIIRFRYPCHSPSSLSKIVDRASKLFNECHIMLAFRGGEYDRYQIILQRTISCALEIASQTYLNELNAQGPNSSLHRDYFERTSFFWERLKDIVRCHREAQLLIHNLEACLLRASHSCAQYQLLQQAPLPGSPQALTYSNMENPRVADGYNVDLPV